MPKKDITDKKTDFDKKLFLKNRSIFISGPVDSKLANRVVEEIIMLHGDNNKAKITVYINSPGGEVHSGFAIFDMLKFIQLPVTTVVIGIAASMGSILSLAASKGRRFMMPNARMMIHQPMLGSFQSVATDIEIQAREIQKTKLNIARLYVDATGKSKTEILADIDRDNWFSAEEALKYGLIDKIVTKTSEL